MKKRNKRWYRCIAVLLVSVFLMQSSLSVSAASDEPKIPDSPVVSETIQDVADNPNEVTGEDEIPVQDLMEETDADDKATTDRQQEEAAAVPGELDTTDESASVAENSETEAVPGDESVQNVQSVELGYIFEIPAEEGKDVYIQLGNVTDVFSELKVTVEQDGSTQEIAADEVIQNVVAFHLKENMKLLTVTGLVKGEKFTTELKTLDETEGIELPIDTSLETNETEEESLEWNIESFVAEDTEEDENAIAEAAQNALAGLPAVMDANGTKTTGNKVVVIDAGHGGKDPGTSRTYNGVTYYEKNITLKIAQYLKSELEQYTDVTVYLTREGDTYPEIKDRVLFAKEKNADILVSIHINATEENSTTASGVLAMVAKIGTYNVENAQSGRDLAMSILTELSTLGFDIKDGGYYERLGSSTYPDGSQADYYGIVRYGQMYSIPSIIVEHGFINNANDFAHMSTDAGLQEMAEADARGIANYLGLSEADKLTGWQTIDGKTYYYGSNGKKVTGTPVIDGKKYWFDENGVQKTGWLYLLDWKMYFEPETGAAKIGMADIGGKRYLFNDDGIMQAYAGTTVVNGKKYWFSDDGGALQMGWLTLGDWKLYFDPDTYEAKTGLVEIDGKMYLFNEDGVMQTYAGTPIVNGKKYWFSDDGGSLKTSWLYLTNWKMYFDPVTYEAKVGFAKIDGKMYLFNDDGVMQNYAGTTVIDGKKYWFSTDDASLQTGWLTLGNWRMYFNPETYAAAVGWVTIEGNKYYFDNNGVLCQGFMKVGNQQYYLQMDGTYATGTPFIDGKKYGFTSSGEQIFGWYSFLSWKLYFDPDNNGAAVTTSKIINNTTYYFNSDGILISQSGDDYITLKDPSNGKTYTLESQFSTDPIVDGETFLAAAIYTESGNQTLPCQIATGLVILNRQESKSYPDTLRYVIYQKTQFEVARNGALTKLLQAYVNNDTSQLKWVKTSEEAASKALEIMNAYKTEGKERQIEGITLPNNKTDFNYLGFMTPAAFERVGLDPVATEAFQVDGTMFYTKWIKKES